MDISIDIHVISVDMDGKCHIHGKNGLLRGTEIILTCMCSWNKWMNEWNFEAIDYILREKLLVYVYKLQSQNRNDTDDTWALR